MANQSYPIGIDLSSDLHHLSVRPAAILGAVKLLQHRLRFIVSFLFLSVSAHTFVSKKEVSPSAISAIRG